MTKICFVSYEIHPTVKGGCGVLLNNLARILLPLEIEVILLLDVGDEDFERFNTCDRLQLPNHELCRAYQVTQLTNDIPYRKGDFHSIFEYRAFRFHLAAKKVYQYEQPDIIEFFDYTGVGYYALSTKVAGLAYEKSHLAVRLHSSLEIIDRLQPGKIHGIDRYIMYAMEHQALRLAETVITPSRTYYTETYQPYYENWFGHLVHEEPPLVDRLPPIKGGNGNNIILFYGRLHGIKGVDVFVDAAISFLSDNNNPRRYFYLVGYDSFQAPGYNESYRGYLLKRIPSSLRNYFIFTGQMDWEQLSELLPKVEMAVIPSYLESFGYAAHELSEAGIPLIVSDIPGFKDYYSHEQNCLVFDGSVTSLTAQMIRLSKDEELRTQISRPKTYKSMDTASFYLSFPKSSWIKLTSGANLPSLLVCIIVDDSNKTIQPILERLRSMIDLSIKVVVLRAASEVDSQQVSSWFLGKMYSFEDINGIPILPIEIKTNDAILILRADDVIDTRFITLGLQTLERNRSLNFVGCWKTVGRKKKHNLCSTPLDAAPELTLFLGSSAYNRFIMRTGPERLLVELFDSRAGMLGELKYLWELDTENSCGIIIPETYITVFDKDERFLDTNVVDYLIIQDKSSRRKSRLARLVLAISDRSKTLRRFHVSDSIDFDSQQNKIKLVREKIYYWLGSSFLSRMLNSMPRLKAIIQKLVIFLLNPGSRER